jgi:hypothetical protein
MSIYTSLLAAGTNSHAETSENANAMATDFVTGGVVGAITNTSGVAPSTGAFAVNAQGSPNMTVAVSSGVAWLAATPSSQNSQNLRVRNTASANVTISSNSSGSTKYDWVYISIDAAKAANPAVDASDVATLVTSRSSSSSSDNGTPPTYGLLLAVVTVSNGAASITNGNIADRRVNASVGGQGGSLIVTQTSSGAYAKVQAAGIDANVDLDLDTKGAGVIRANGTQLGAQAFKNPYKFSAYRSTAYTTVNGTFTKMPFNSVLYDTGSNYDATTNFRFTAPIAGFYLFNAGINMSATNPTNFRIDFYKNGSQIAAGNQPFASTGGAQTTKLLQLAAGDYVEAWYFANTAATVSASAPFTYFEGILMSAA